MALAETLPYGLRDVKVTPYTNSTTLGTSVDLPASRTFSFEEGEDFEELRGDDKLIAMRGNGASVSWELESGGISLEAYKKKVTDSRPEFKVEGQAMSESGGDFHVVLDRCKATENLTGELADGSFWLTGASGTAFPSRLSGNTDQVYRFIQNETATSIS